jgi:ethanolamine utilization protein EutA
MRQQWLTSVGIDVGTSTTKMIVSKLKIARMSSPFALPRYEIVERIIAYESPIIATPLLSQNEIHAERVAGWLEEQYKRAGIKQSDVQSGAIIFTGETASKSNAEPLLHQLSLDSGSFVVAAAGCDLEAVLAAKGSGAEAYSLQTKEIIANIDIGGGTANIAYCFRGQTIHTVTFHVGGRLLRLDPDGKLLYVSDVLGPWLQDQQIELRIGDRLSLYELREITRMLVCSMLSYLAGDYDGSGRLLLVKQPGAAPPDCQTVMVTGGVGHWFNQTHEVNRSLTMESITQFGDFGPLLAHVLKAECSHYNIATLQPMQTVRATVLGAGMQSTEISGSTVYIEQGILPLRNIPVIKIDLTTSFHSDLQQESWKQHLQEIIETAFKQAATLYAERSSYKAAFAFALTGLKSCTYAVLQFLSAQLATTYGKYFPNNMTMIVICENDMAKALGQSLHLHCLGHPSIICIDQIFVRHGDYVDLGEPIKGATIPVIVKTLAF